MKKTIKKLTAVLLTLAILTAIMSVSFTVSASEESKVRVIIKNNVFSVSDGASWDGTLVDEWVNIDSNSTMMSAVLTALDNHGYTQTGAEFNYITEINNLKAYDGGSMSGWMGTLNDWFTNNGADYYTVSNGTLENGDEICYAYSNNYGEDLGSFWSNNDTTVMSIDFSKGQLSPAFSSGIKDYTLTLSNADDVIVTPTASNKNFQTRTYKNEYTPSENGTEYKRSQHLSVVDGDKIIVGCGNENWDSMNTSKAENVYTITVKVENFVADKLNSTANYLNSLDVNLFGAEWSIIGRARAEKLSQTDIDNYYASVVSKLNEVGSSKIDKNKSTENSRVIIALSSIGKDATKIENYNLLEPLADFDFVKKQGLNGPVWALIALDTYGYEIPIDENVATQTTREMLIDFILNNALENGGWTFFGSTADPDMTGMAIQALAPYYSKNNAVKTAVDKALDVLSNAQKENGGFTSWGTDNVESAAQVLTALSSLGINVDSDTRFVKNGNTLVDAIMSFSVENGFSHTSKLTYNQMATEQSFYALVSYNRVKNGKTSLYDMSDISKLRYDINGDGALNITDCTLIQKYIVALETLDSTQLAKADADSNGVVNVNDVTMLQKLLVL